MLYGLNWKETSGVDDPANAELGWVVMKATDPQPAADPAADPLVEQVQQTIAREQQLFAILRQHDFTGAPEPVRKATQTLLDHFQAEYGQETPLPDQPPRSSVLERTIEFIVRKFSPSPSADRIDFDIDSEAELEEAGVALLQERLPAFQQHIQQVVADASLTPETRQLIIDKSFELLAEEVRGPYEMMKKTFSDSKRQDLADKGQALPGGGYPIESRQDVANAIQAIGRAKDPAAAKALICRMARKLNCLDLIPDNGAWPCKAKGADSKKGND